MKDIKARYRNKVGKIIIEVWNGEKWLYVKTLSDPLKEFSAECLAKVSLNKPINEQKDTQKFAQDLLPEPLKQDTIPRNELEILEQAKRAASNIMKDILSPNKPKSEPSNNQSTQEHISGSSTNTEKANIE